MEKNLKIWNFMVLEKKNTFERHINFGVVTTLLQGSDFLDRVNYTRPPHVGRSMINRKEPKFTESGEFI